MSLVCASAQKAVHAGSLDISKVVSSFPVGFCLLTTPERQYAAYYDESRNMVVASREIKESKWVYQILPTKIGWDSHNYVTMAIDSKGHLHVSGNMHKVPLIYFRTQKPGDITSLKRESMTGKNESGVTYPNFFTDKQNRLIFSYREGGSGDGITFYNRYDPEQKKWSRLFDTPLFDGEKKRNAYPSVPKLGPDGMFHVHWVWRETSDCATNHHLSYMRSADLVQWESVRGEKVKLPIRLDESKLYVDPVPVGGGLLNGGHQLVFDSAGNPILVYHRSDASGNMQMYAARPDGGKWKAHALTKWSKPVKFGGGGSMAFVGIRLSNVIEVAPDAISLNFRHKDYGSGTIQFHAKTFELIDKHIPKPSLIPKELNRVESKFPGMMIRRSNDLGSSGVKGESYVLQWEALEANHDKPRDPPFPEASQLRVHKIRYE